MRPAERLDRPPGRARRSEEPQLADGEPPLLEDREFFVRKAIGWVLRERGKKRPAEVYRWLLPRAGRASGVTVREAVKYLEPSQREAILDRYGKRAARPPKDGVAR